MEVLDWARDPSRLDQHWERVPSERASEASPHSVA